MNGSDPDELRERVRRRYASAARAAAEPTGVNAGTAARGEQGGGAAVSPGSSCCATVSPPGPSSPGPGDCGAVSRDLYSSTEVAELPGTAVLASLGCGNPTALAQLDPGEVVLDLGSGGGIDVLLSARRVGPDGFAYGVDMTDEMLDLARRSAAKHGATNVRFLTGTIEAVPLPDEMVDVVLSNCVINLSADKGQVLREAFRLLRPGGRLAVADIVVQGHLPEDVRASMEQWVGCVAGALDEETYLELLAAAGFEEMAVEVTRDHGEEMAREAGSANQSGSGTGMAGEGGRVVSAFIRARKPSTTLPLTPAR